jgi:hypothetical protein
MARGQVNIESRPSGTRVISARLPAPLAEQLLSMASHCLPSVLIRQAVEAFLCARPAVAGLSATCSGRMRRDPLPGQYETVNVNLVTEPSVVERVI